MQLGNVQHSLGSHAFGDRHSNSWSSRAAALRQSRTSRGGAHPRSDCGVIERDEGDDPAPRCVTTSNVAPVIAHPGQPGYSARAIDLQRASMPASAATCCRVEVRSHRGGPTPWRRRSLSKVAASTIASPRTAPGPGWPRRNRMLPSISRGAGIGDAKLSQPPTDRVAVAIVVGQWPPPLHAAAQRRPASGQPTSAREARAPGGLRYRSGA